MSTTEHPLTEDRAAEMWGAHAGGYVTWEDWYGGSRRALAALLRAVFDAGREHEREHADDRPWEPLNGGPLHVGDEVRREAYGLTISAVVGRVDEDGDPWAAEGAAGGAFIGLLRYGTWYFRRPVPELPTTDGAVIVPADGHEHIGAQGARLFARLTYSRRLRHWYGVAVNGGPTWASVWYGEPEKITPGTWKVDDQ